MVLRTIEPDPYRRIPLMNDPIGREERAAAMQVLNSGRVTQGPRVRQFEEAILGFLEVDSSKDAAMVNSGSSANLLAATLMRELVRPGWMHVVTPAVTWSTTVAPLIQKGFKPVFADIGPDYCLDPKMAGEAMEAYGAGSIAVVHLLGNPADVARLSTLKDDEGTGVLWEDCCEALGAARGSKRVGSIGQISTHSFYLSHITTTIEGGAIVYPRVHDQVRAWREHGWIRQYPEVVKQAIAAENPELDARWIFQELGYNVRSTELNAAIGLVQLDKLDAWILKRRLLANGFDVALKHYTLRQRVVQPESKPVPFSYPIHVHEDAPYKAAELRAHLESWGVETRPLMSGDIRKHPWYKRHPEAWTSNGELPNTVDAHENAFLIPCHPGLVIRDVEHLIKAMDAFLKAHTGEGLS